MQNCTNKQRLLKKKENSYSLEMYLRPKLRYIERCLKLQFLQGIFSIKRVCCNGLIKSKKKKFPN